MSLFKKSNALILVILLMLTACGGGDSNGGGSTDPIESNGVEKLGLFPQDLDGGRCYNDDTTESNRPPYGPYPLELVTEEAYELEQLEALKLRMAKEVLDIAKSAATPKLQAPILVFNKDEALVSYQLMAALKLADVTFLGAKISHKKRSLKFLLETLEKPSLSWNSLIVEGNTEALGPFYLKRFISPDGILHTRELVQSTAGVAVATEVVALGTTIVTASIIESIRRDRVPQLEQEIKDTEEEYGLVSAEYSDLVNKGLQIFSDQFEFNFWTIPSVDTVKEHEAAKVKYDQALNDYDAASNAYYDAFTASVDEVPTDPPCDSDELLFELQTLCASPFDLPTPEEEDYDGQAEWLEGVLNELCGKVRRL